MARLVALTSKGSRMLRTTALSVGRHEYRGSNAQPPCQLPRLVAALLLVAARVLGKARGVVV